MNCFPRSPSAKASRDGSTGWPSAWSPTWSGRGTFAERGYRNPVTGLCDLLGWDRTEARRHLVAADQAQPRVGLDGTPLPPRLPSTAEVFAAGGASLRHIDTIARLLATPTARRLAPAVWAGAEAELAAKTTDYSPTELLEWGTR